MGRLSGKPEAGSTQQATSGERSGIHTRKASAVSGSGGAAPLRLKNKRALFVVLLLAALIVVPLTVNGAKKRQPRQKRANTTSTSAIRPAMPAGCAGTAPAPQNDAFELRAMELVNRERAAVGLPPMRRVDALSGSARWFARDMATQDYFAQDHDTYRRSGERLVRACDWSARLGFFYPEWSSLAENIAAGYATPEETVAGWMGSPTHRTKILSHGQWETGVGYWRGGSEGHYWVQDFGRRSGTAPEARAGTP